jgi:ADP-ribosylglycohydrolase
MAGEAERARGILLGLLMGDRNGGPIQMALELASSLRRLGRFSLNDVRLRYLTWFLREGTDTGPVSARVFELISFGVEPGDAVAQVHREFGGLTAGCNPAHRAAPLAMCSFIADDDLPATAVQEAKLTHEHGLAGDVSAAVVVLCRALIRGAAWSEALEVAAVARQPATQATMSLAITPALKSGGFAPDVLRAGISFVDRHSSFEAALSEALPFAGPANYCPVLVGSIAGARWGASEIVIDGYPRREILRRALEVSQELSSQWIPRPSDSGDLHQPQPH